MPTTQSGLAQKQSNLISEVLQLTDDILDKLRLAAAKVDEAQRAGLLETDPDLNQLVQPVTEVVDENGVVATPGELGALAGELNHLTPQTIGGGAAAFQALQATLNSTLNEEAASPTNPTILTLLEALPR